MSFKEWIMAAASAGGTLTDDWGRSPCMCTKEFEELLLGAGGWEGEFGEPTTDGGYHEFVGTSWGRAGVPCSWEPL